MFCFAPVALDPESALPVPLTVEPGANLLILPVSVDDATLWDHGRIILPVCVGVRFGVFGVTAAFTLPPSVPTQGQTLEVGGGLVAHDARGTHLLCAFESLPDLSPSGC